MKTGSLALAAADRWATAEEAADGLITTVDPCRCARPPDPTLSDAINDKRCRSCSGPTPRRNRSPWLARKASTLSLTRLRDCRLQPASRKTGGCRPASKANGEKRP